MLKLFSLCKPYLLTCKYRIGVYLAISLTTTILTILSPYIIGSFLDVLITGADVGIILRFCAVFGGLNLIKIVNDYLVAIMRIKIINETSYDLKMDAIKHIQKASLSYIYGKDRAYLTQTIASDSRELIIFCLSISQNVIMHLISLIVPLGILLSINWLTAVLMITFLLLYMILYRIFKESLHKVGFAFKEAQSTYFSGLLEQLKHVKLIKVNSIQKEMNRRAYHSFMVFNHAAISKRKVSHLYSGLDGIVSTIAQITLFLIGGLQILAGNFTIGMFTIFSSYFNMMLSSSRYFFSLGALYQDILVSYRRINEVFAQKQESCGKKTIDKIEQIQLRHVNFTYPLNNGGANRNDKLTDHDKHAKQIINNFCADFSKGKIYTITGINGAGKSTLLSLIMGLYIDEFTGVISYDGIDIRQLDMLAIRKHLIGFAEQEPLLVTDSIRYNLDFGSDDEINIESLQKYIAILNMKDFFLTRTLDFRINEGNTNTSGGEKQKVAILSVLNKDPLVMIFDEPTSALDRETTEEFIKYLRLIKEHKIIIMITHDEKIKSWSDEVIAL